MPKQSSKQTQQSNSKKTLFNYFKGNIKETSAVINTESEDVVIQISTSDTNIVNSECNGENNKISPLDITSMELNHCITENTNLVIDSEESTQQQCQKDDTVIIEKEKAKNICSIFTKTVKKDLTFPVIEVRMSCDLLALSNYYFNR